MKSEILARLAELANQDKVLNDLSEFNDLTAEFYRLQEEEERLWEIQKLERIEAGEKPEAIEKPVFELLADFKKLSTLYKDKKKIEQNEIKEKQKVNYDKKKALIAALKDLIQNEENIGKAISRFNDIRDSWNDVGTVPREKRQGLQNEFSSLVENFKYNINIYKDIKDYDLTRNLNFKKELIKNLKGLLKIDRIKEVEEKLNTYQEEWNNIGGTNPSDWEKIKGEYWDTVNAIYEKIHEFYRNRKEERAGNIEKKKGLLEKLKAIVEKEIDEHKGWKKSTDAIVGLQEEWKKIGFGPKEENNAIWKEFRGVCNEFFAKKKLFYGELSSEFDGVKEKKEALIAEAAALKDSTDWKETTNKIVSIQKRWKEVGSAGPKFENQLWKKFRAQIDYFFENKDKHFKEAGASSLANLKAKEAIVEKLKTHKLNKDGKKAIDELKALSAEFDAVGNVPFKEKDNIYKVFKKALDDQFDAIKMDQSEKEMYMLEAKLDSISSSDNSEYLLDKEQGNIRRKIARLNEEVTKYETNMSFFGNVDEKNPLFKSVIESLEKTKAEIEILKAQLKKIRIVENQLNREAEAAEESAEGSTSESSNNE